MVYLFSNPTIWCTEPRPEIGEESPQEGQGRWEGHSRQREEAKASW